MHASSYWQEEENLDWSCGQRGWNVEAGYRGKNGGLKIKGQVKNGYDLGHQGPVIRQITDDDDEH